MGISGEGFCTSAYHGFLLNLKYTGKFYWGVKLANMFIGLGIVAVTCLSVGCSWISFKYIFKEAHTIGSALGYIGPLMAFFVISIVTVIIFLGLFDEAVLAMIVCYGVDMDMNGG